MSLHRLPRRFVVPAAGLTLAGAVVALSGTILLESVERAPRERGASFAAPAPTLKVERSRPAFPELRARLDEARKSFTPESNRERAWLLHEMARSDSKDARRYVIHLAESEASDPIERLAAISALHEVHDPALAGIAATTTNSLVLAKLQAVRVASARPTPAKR